MKNKRRISSQNQPFEAGHRLRLLLAHATRVFIYIGGLILSDMLVSF